MTDIRKTAIIYSSLILLMNLALVVALMAPGIAP